jgi:hypothetical protein
VAESVWESYAVLRLVLLASGAVVALLLVDRLLLAAESRGWIYWRRRRSSPGTRASALLELHAMLEPDRRHTAEILREETQEEDDEGGPKHP